MNLLKDFDEKFGTSCNDADCQSDVNCFHSRSDEMKSYLISKLREQLEELRLKILLLKKTEPLNDKIFVYNSVINHVEEILLKQLTELEEKV